MFEGMTADEIWGYVAVWAILSAIVALVASARGRGQVNWFIIAFLVSPVIAFVVLVLMPNLKEARRPPVAPVGTPPCPRCGTQRVAGQRHCPGCGLDLWADYDARNSGQAR